MEIEAKYTVLDQRTYTVLSRLHQIAGFRVEDGETRTILDTYFDTKDYRLLTSGYACRRRREDGETYLTLKGLSTSSVASDAVHRRTEIEIPIDEGVAHTPNRWPEGSLRDLVLDLNHGRDLTSILEIEQLRHVRYLHGDDGAVVAEMSLDEVSVRGGSKTRGFIELEIEMVQAGRESDLSRIAADMAEIEGLTAQPTSKFERGLALVGVIVTPNRSRVSLHRDDTIGQAARTVLRPLFLKMQMHEQGTYLGEDPEELHDMRVATRRMRAFLRVTGPYLDEELLAPVCRGLRRTARILGAVRDMDVFREKTEHYLAESETPAGALTPLMKAWNIEYTRRRNEMLAYLSGPDYAHFKQRFWRHLEDTLPERDRPIQLRHAVHDVVDAQIERLHNSSAALRQAVNDHAAYHQVRIDVKHLRYTLEFFRAILGPEAREAIEVLKYLQDHFGDLQDAVVAARHLRAVAAYGTWEIPRQSHSLWSASEESRGSTGVPDAVWTYLKVRETEIQALTAGTPQAWREFRDHGVTALVRMALGTFESEDAGQPAPAA